MAALNAMLQPAFTLAQDLEHAWFVGQSRTTVAPLVLLGIAIILLWISGRGDNAMSPAAASA